MRRRVRGNLLERSLIPSPGSPLQEKRQQAGGGGEGFPNQNGGLHSHLRHLGVSTATTVDKRISRYLGDR